MRYIVYVCVIFSYADNSLITAHCCLFQYLLRLFLTAYRTAQRVDYFIRERYSQMLFASVRFHQIFNWLDYDFISIWRVS